MRLLLFMIIFPVLSTFGQDFKMVRVDSIVHKRHIDDIAIFETYTLDHFEYYIGWNELANTDNYGLQLFVFNPEGEIIFRSKRFMDSYTHSLTFFRSDKNPNQTFILGHSSNEYSWGNEVYLLQEGTFKYLGLLDVATNETLDIPWDISEYTQIWTEANQIRFTFSYDSLIYNPGGKNECILTNQQIEYRYQNGKLEEEIKR